MLAAYLSLAGATLAFVTRSVAAVSVWRSYRPIRAVWVMVHAGVALFSGMYVVAFIWLIWGSPDRASWSETMLPITTAVFVFVWSLPAIIAIIESRALKR